MKSLFALLAIALLESGLAFKKKDDKKDAAKKDDKKDAAKPDDKKKPADAEAKPADAEVEKDKVAKCPKKLKDPDNLKKAIPIVYKFVSAVDGDEKTMSKKDLDSYVDACNKGHFFFGKKALKDPAKLKKKEDKMKKLADKLGLDDKGDDEKKFEADLTAKLKKKILRVKPTRHHAKKLIKKLCKCQKKLVKKAKKDAKKAKPPAKPEAKPAAKPPKKHKH